MGKVHLRGLWLSDRILDRCGARRDISFGEPKKRWRRGPKGHPAPVLVHSLREILETTTSLTVTFMPDGIGLTWAEFFAFWASL